MFKELFYSRITYLKKIFVGTTVFSTVLRLFLIIFIKQLYKSFYYYRCGDNNFQVILQLFFLWGQPLSQAYFYDVAYLTVFPLLFLYSK